LKFAVNVGLIVISVLVSWFIFEKVSQSASKRVEIFSLVEPEQQLDDSFWQYGSAMHRPSVKLKHRLSWSDSVIYDVNYTSDQFGRRHTPQIHPSKSRHLLFFGCSLTYGIGVQDDESIPSIVGKMMPGYHAYNYAIPSGGLGNFLYILRHTDIRRQVAETEGAAVYFLQSRVHLPRLEDGLPSLLIPGRNPRFHPNSTSDDVEFKGSFNETRGPLHKSLAYLLMGSTVGHRMMSLIKPYQNSNVQLGALMIERGKAEYLRHFPKGNFVVVSFDGDNRMDKALQEKGIDHLKLKFPDVSHEKMFFAHDGHYTAHGNELISELIKSALEDHLAKSPKQLRLQL
jgi:hypothetical protein